MRQRIRDARERRDCQKVVPNARDHCEQSKEYFDPSDLGDVTYARPSDCVSGVKDLNGNPIKATFEAFQGQKSLLLKLSCPGAQATDPNRNGEEKSKQRKMRDTVPAPAHVWSTGHFGFFTSQDARWRKVHPRSKGQSRNKLLLIDVKADKPEHPARRGHPTLPYRRSAGRRRSRIISCLTKGIEEGQRRRQVRDSHCPLTLSPRPRAVCSPRFVLDGLLNAQTH